MSENRPLILIVEDDPPIRRFLRTSLGDHGFEVVEAERGDQALRMARSQPADLIVLDLGLPDTDGLAVIRQLRAPGQPGVPIVVVSARGQEKEKVAALDAGADDYVTKPFGIDELLARIRVALRHATRILGSHGEESAVFQAGDLRVDLEARRVYVADKDVHLTPIEYKLLTTLARHAGKVLTHQFLLKEVWGPTYVDQAHYLRVFMTSLRRKLEADPARPRYLLTEQGVGYRLAEE